MTARLLDLSDPCADGYHSNCDSMARPCECHCHEEQKTCPACDGQAVLSGAGPNLAWVCVDCGWEVMA